MLANPAWKCFSTISTPRSIQWIWWVLANMCKRYRHQEKSRNYQEIDSKIDILHQLIIGHRNIADCDSQTQDFLHLEFNGWLKVFNLSIVGQHYSTFFWGKIEKSYTTIHTLLSMDSEWVRSVGNLPALFKPGPSNLGICLMRDSEARKALYFLAAVRKGIRGCCLYLLKHTSKSTTRWIHSCQCNMNGFLFGNRKP